ncbi:DUF5979 domain-containing protein [Corynebacterium qintianiae]|uniref:DUF5979 domain-containing protein n=1 Tax=Corynebacterium qintianiae TaxID=2709392 RepID=UPI0013ED64A0|nr:DUF5979 domain-containing protein [Corynebacterium qintianiae]
MSTDSAFGDTTAGQRVFSAYEGDAKTPIIAKQATDYTELGVDDISLTKGGVPQNFNVVVADAESTARNSSPGEMLSVVADGGSNLGYYRITPSGYQNACSDTANFRDTIFGPGQYNKPIEWGSSTSGFRDFICRVPSFIYGPPTRPGTWIYERSNPTSLRIATAGSRNVPQAFAMGINLSRASVPSTPVSVDSQAFELKQTGQQTTFNPADFKVYDRQGTTDTPIDAAPGTTGAYIRARNGDGSYAGSVVYRSTATGAQANMATKRYAPTWTCTLSDSNSTSITRTFTAGSEPADMPVKVNNSADGTSSEVVVTDPTGRVPSCSVQWKTRFQPATLDLQKSVTGNAANFSDIQLRTFTLNYTCNDLVSGGVAASQAYPGIKLSGSATLQRGTSQKADALPKGANCTVTEDQASAKPPSGTTLDLTWNTAPTGPAPSPNGGAASYSVQLQDTNTGHAYNQYTYGTGTLVLSNEILGQPVDDGFKLNSYDFEILCTGTNLGTWRATITMTRSGTQVSGSTKVGGIPVGQDCTVRPLTDLSGAQREQVKFAGRVVTVDGTTVQADPNANFGYHFTLPVTEASRSEMHFRTTYEYVLRDVFVTKVLDGPAAGSSDLTGATYTVNYRCTAPTGKEFTGTVSVGVGATDVKISQIPVGSACNMWEDQPADTDNTVFSRAVLRSSNANDQLTEVANANGETTPVLTVRPSQDSERNLVTVVNTYDYRLSTVTVKKVVENSSVVAAPDTYTIRFTCGTRNIGNQAVLLEGSAQVSAGGSVTLAASNEAANDQSGAMGVPYGNECTFTEDQPQLSEALIMSTDVADQDLTVSALSSTVTVTNTFTPAGDGFTLSQSLGGVDDLFPERGMSYTLVCQVLEGDQTQPVDPEARPVVPTRAKKTYEFSLADAGKYHIDAAELPVGSECTLTEDPADLDPLTRTNFKRTEYAIDRSVTLTSSDPDQIAFGKAFTIGEKTVANVAALYAYKPSTVTSTKAVLFDRETAHYISEERKQVKLSREFPVTLACTNPDGSAGVNISTTIANGQQRTQDKIPEGSECTGTEGATTTATGVDLNTRIGLNTAEGSSTAAGNSITFTARAGDDRILVENIYSRRLTSVRLDKVARLPGNVREQYKASGQNLQNQLYTHTFTLVCKDPETGDTATLLETTETIQGEDFTTFEDVPVGADCSLKGDNFGSLRLKMTDGGQNLEAYLKPKEVDWVIDRLGRNSYADTDLGDGVTQGPAVQSVDDPAANHVTLTNNYDYETSTVRLDKTVTGDEAVLKLLAADTQFRFALQCKAIGYQTSTIGTGENVIPATLAKSDFDGSWRYSSPAASVPAGSLCTFKEVSPTALPQELKMAVTSSSNEDPAEKDPAIATGRAPAPGIAEPTVFSFTDTIERRTSPVGLKLRHTGYLVGASPDGYTATVTCGVDEASRSYALNMVNTGALPTSDGPLAIDDTIELPVGVECKITYASSPALAARGEVEVVKGDRRPYMRFATWTGEDYEGADTALVNLPLNDVQGKKYDTTFTVPVDASSTTTTFIVGAEFHHPRAAYDVRFTKKSEGSEGDGNTFEFTQACGPVGETFTLRDRGTHVIKDVPVNQQCTVTETNDGSENVDPVLAVTASGTRIAEPTAGSGSVGFTVLPTTSGDDTSTGGAEWAVTALNSFPGISVTKRIPGTPVSAVTGAVANRAILADNAKSFDITYTVKNTGVFDSKITQLVDESLAGYTVTSAIGAAEIGPDGLIPPEVCALSTLAPGKEYTCTFNVDIIGEPTDETFNYFGEVQVTAVSSDQQLTATDGYGALRLTGIIGALLPDTGMQTLVWMLVIGLLLFGFGAWRYLRREAESEIEEGEDSHEIN